MLTAVAPLMHGPFIFTHFQRRTSVFRFDQSAETLSDSQSRQLFYCESGIADLQGSEGV